MVLRGFCKKTGKGDPEAVLRPLCYHEPSELNFGEGVEGTISNLSEVK